MKVFILLSVSCLWISSATARVADHGREDWHPSGAIPAILSVDPAVCVFDQQFVEKFTSADESVRNQLLEEASALELVQFMENPHNKLIPYHSQASDAFGRRYGSRTLVIISNQTNDDVTVYENEIVFKNAQAFVDFALVVKDKIQSLKIDFAALGYRYELEETLGFVQRNLAGKLKSLELRGVFGNEFELLKDFRFTQLKKLSFASSYLYHTEFDLKKTFPAVTSLSSTYTEFGNRDWIQKYFPTITELEVDIDSRHYFTKEEVLDILQKNRNIKSLGLVSSENSQELLRNINENFSNIKNLGIIPTSFESNTNQAVVEMRHVENFLYENPIDFNYTEFIKFKNLKELQWHSIENPEYLLLKTIKDHAKQIVSLEIEDAELTDAHLAKMNNLEKLERVSFGFDPDKRTTAMTAAGLMKFINANQNIAAVRLVRAKKPFFKSVYAAVQGTNLAKWLVNPIPPFYDEANIYLVRPGKTVQWVDNLEFLRNRFN